ncbi:hypothetical protein [Winogradskyella sp.]|uniref:hypothetical protein n=1 Tax=Winogradskyella sp. TaxID=1883156 RepID=UPI003BAB553B
MISVPKVPTAVDVAVNDLLVGHSSSGMAPVPPMNVSWAKANWKEDRHRPRANTIGKNFSTVIFGLLTAIAGNNRMFCNCVFIVISG